ncbi:TonB-dependent receptor [Petrachloros mirabilis]
MNSTVVRLALCVLASLVPVSANGQSEDVEDVIETREVVVSSTRLPDTPVDARTLPAKVTVVTAEDIKKSGAKTVQEAVQWATGIVMYDQVGNAFQQTIDLRGFNGQPVPATSVFLDGMRMNEPDFNAVSFDLIPFDTIERIEIIPGASAIYGKNAMGGVVNIVTKRGGDKHQATGETVFGSFHRERYTINASGPLGDFDYYTNFGRETESGYRDESAARISRFFGKLGYRPSKATDVTLSFTYVNDRIQQAGSLPISVEAIDPKRNFTPGDFFANETNVVRLTGRQTLPFGLSLNVNGFYRRLDQDQFTRSQPFCAAALAFCSRNLLPNATNLVLTESKGATGQVTHESVWDMSRNTLVVGGEFTRNDIGTSRRSQSETFFSAGQGTTDEDIAGVYVQDTLNIASRIVITAGLRYDHSQIRFTDLNSVANSGDKRFNRATPRVGVTYLATSETSVYFSYGESFRVPTSNELFALGSFGSNPNLKPVHGRHYEVGVKSAIGRLGEVSLSLYRTDVTDEILIVCGDPFTCGATTFASNTNIDRSRRQGVEATWKSKLSEVFDFTVNYTYTDATIQSDLTLNPFFFDEFGGTPYIQQVKKGSSFPLVPKHRLGVVGNVHPVRGWTLSLAGLYVSTQFMLNDEQNVQPRLPGYFVLNGRVA